MRRAFVVLTGFLVLSTAALFAKPARSAEAELKGSYRLAPKNGWTYVHLEGTPHQVGFQNGYLLAPEVADMLKVAQLETARSNKKDWAFFRHAAEQMMWPHIEAEYREELQGVADGARAHGITLDLWDVVAMNALLEWDYYVKQYDQQHAVASSPRNVAEHCSAFVAIGSYTKDGKVVIAHNNWSSYLEGERWTIVYDIAPAHGYRVIMDGIPGIIHSADDFVINSAGIAITETTIGHFSGYDPAGIPEFVRARKAAQYSASIDDFARIMKEGNNGGYANTWLIADATHNEIARLELGLKNVTLERSTDGVFVGANYPINPKLIKEETNYDVNDMSQSSAARRVRWGQLISENKGKIDTAAAERFLGDHYDTYEKKEEPSERTLDGHVELSARGYPGWVEPYGTAGAVQNKVADAAMIKEMSFYGAAGHACGLNFKPALHLTAHPEFAWQKDLQRDLDAHPWTKFSAAK